MTNFYPAVLAMGEPDGWDDLSKPLAVDAEIKGLARGPRRRVRLSPAWQDEATALRFGRNLLSRAYRDALGPHPARQRLHERGEWETALQHAAPAHDAMRRLLRSLSPIDPTFTDAHALSRPLTRLVQEQSPGLDLMQAQAEARRQADAMLSTLRVLAALPAHLETHRAEIAAECQNPGQPEKVAFVGRAALGWARLTGKAPGSGQDPSASPFVAFLDAMWADLGGEETSFAAMVKPLATKAADIEREAAAWAIEDGEDDWPHRFEMDPLQTF